MHLCRNYASESAQNGESLLYQWACCKIFFKDFLTEHTFGDKIRVNRTYCSGCDE